MLRSECGVAAVTGGWVSRGYRGIASGLALLVLYK